jgi:SM-20-related protein
MLNIEAIREATAAHEPFAFFQAQVLAADDLNQIRADFPAIEKPGVYPLDALQYGPGFASLLEDIQSPALAKAVGEKLGLDLVGLPVMITVRGQAQSKDGRIHTDTKDKVATCLLYLNGVWDEGGGRLRLLRNGHDLEDYIAEVPPNGGAFVAFKVSHNSWHGHKPYVGERRYVMVNWLRSESAHARQLGRHKLSAKVKRLIPFFYRGK